MMNSVVTVAKAALAVLFLTIGAHAQTLLWQEVFDGVVAPELPAGWTASDPGFETSTSVEGPGSGLNNLMHKGTSGGYIDLPALDLSQVTSGIFAFYARRTGSYEADALRLLASIDGGATFPLIVMQNGEALPGVDSEYVFLSSSLPAGLLGESDVRLRFETLGGGSAFASFRLDDMELTGTGDIPANRFGFRVAAETLQLANGRVSVPLDLSLGLTEAGLQGLQFTVLFDQTAITVEDLSVISPAISGAEWQLEVELGPGSLRGVLIGQGTASVPAGTHSPLLMLDLSPGDPSTSTVTTLTVVGVVASEANPEGVNLPVVVAESALELTIEPTMPVFVSDLDSLDFGVVRVGESVQRVVSVSNSGGTGPLQIDSVWTSASFFLVAPNSVTVPIDESAVFTVEALPTIEDTGVHSATLHFRHNAEFGESEIVLVATVMSGRGDINEDMSVDIVDLVWGIDIVLDRISPTAEQLAAADLYPFPAGDGTVDVRDLTVLTQAIARGIWPDNIDLGPAFSPSMKSESSTEEGGDLVFAFDEEGLWLSLDVTRELRALHVVFSLPGPDLSKQKPFQVAAPDRMTVITSRRASDQAYSMVLYRGDGGSLAPGSYELGNLIIDSPSMASIRIERAEAVSTERSRLRLTSRVVFGSGVATSPRESTPMLGGLYPMPFATGGDLSIPVYSRDGDNFEVAIYDALGREVTKIRKEVTGAETVRWDGRDRLGRFVGPGLYVLRASATGSAMHQTFIVVQKQ